MRLGVLDIGSNTVHLLLVDAHPGGRPVPFASHKKPLQLVAYLDEDGSISREGQDELVGFVREARAFAAGHDAEDFLAFCTSAIREAGNGREVLTRVREETGVDLQELSGDQEAAVTFQAVRRWYGWGAESILNLDIGGGSFEMAAGMLKRAPKWVQSAGLEWFYRFAQQPKRLFSRYFVDDLPYFAGAAVRAISHRFRALPG